MPKPGPITFTEFEPNVYMGISFGMNASGLTPEQLIAALRDRGVQKIGTYHYLSYMKFDPPQSARDALLRSCDAPTASSLGRCDDDYE